MTAVALVSCSSKKLGCAAPARLLYSSPLFRASLYFAETLGVPVFVVSAKHELVALDDVLEPYDDRLQPNIHSRRAWGTRVAESVHKLDAIWQDRDQRHGVRRDVIALAGVEYTDALLYGFGEVRKREINARNYQFDYRVQQPLLGMQIGQRLSWLKSAALANEPTSADPIADLRRMAAQS